MSRQPILDLSTLVTRPTIRVDGTLYELLSPDELSILDSQRLTLWGKEIEALALVEGKEAELNQVVATVARKVIVDMPEKVFAKLSEAHRLSVVEVFTSLLLQRKMGVAGALAKVLVGAMANRQTGGKPSRASSASSAAPRPTGSKKRRRRS